MLKTTIGSLLSMQREMAVASITFNPRSKTSRYVMRGNFVACGVETGSAL
jgi:hypothetical protein